MTEITRVPLQPIAKGSIPKLWLGVVLAIFAAAGLAWAALPKGVSVDVVAEGTGPSPTRQDVIFVRYTGRLADGTVFDQSQDVQLPIQGLLPAGSPLPLSRFQVVPPSREIQRPLPAPPLVRPQVWISICQVPANRMRGLLGSITRSEAPVLSLTKRTRSQLFPPSVVR